MVVSKKNQLLASSEAKDAILLEKKALLKGLVSQVAASSAPLKVLQQTAQTIEEVIAEFDIDGTHYYLARSRSTVETKTSQISLSPREKAIANLVAQGLPNKCIGSQLDISPWTVSTHLRRMFTKLNVTSRSAMISRLFQENLLQN
jgi:DNA-binding NarL/FixJ family response regulator